MKINFVILVYFLFHPSTKFVSLYEIEKRESNIFNKIVNKNNKNEKL